jgi:RNA polymerase sigma factor (TIGR02999 family)
MSHDPRAVTLLLEASEKGDKGASARLMEIVYGELRALAGSYARAQDKNHTLQPTALVHEAFLKLVTVPSEGWKDRAHFFAVAARAMRQVLMDHARAKRTQKRDAGAFERITLDGSVAPEAGRDLDLLALDDALQELAELDPRAHRVVELRYFGGLTVEEVAPILSVSVTTVESDWRSARAWLATRLGQ